MIDKGPSDKHLIEQYISGDKSSMAILVKRWHKVFCEKAFWILRDKDLSKDVAQECWIIMINKLHTLKKAESFKSWALRIVYTKSIDAHHRRSKEMRDLKNISQNVRAEGDDDDVRTMLKRKLLKSIQNLPQDKQDIIRLFYVEQYTLKEISSFLHIPVGTAKSRLFQAREKLKSIINTKS